MKIATIEVTDRSKWRVIFHPNDNEIVECDDLAHLLFWLYPRTEDLYDEDGDLNRLGSPGVFAATGSASEEPHPTLADVNAELSALVRHMENNAAQALDLLRRCRPNVGTVGALAEDIDRFLKWGADISNGGDDDN